MSLSRSISESILAVGGDPTDHTWEWLATQGPHGDRFTWGQTKSEPPGYVGIEHLEKVVAERQDADLTFRQRVRDIVRVALASTDARLSRRAIQLAGVVGGEEELHRIVAMTTSGEEAVAADAKACSFYLKRRLKSERGRNDG